ncbi:hypothetical protein K6U06_18740 [Acidiferrimicrobium sp. IK]|uniref:hypothetical protein n=1 Tax=Acidiferrimicrobium sp. IK TaxID=2871700 RepID=UPI0021CB39FE|nr:hypothetical protein [Acidiferrimicrobium sp. IK]MCU4186412.1 hypothetical protein [Acidiferrimicrobium sp. IK]
MILKQKILVGVTALAGMGIGSLGVGVAHAQTPPPPAPAARGVLAPASSAPEAAAGVESDGPGGHQDPNGVDVQYGSQSGPDTGGSANSGS